MSNSNIQPSSYNQSSSYKLFNILFFIFFFFFILKVLDKLFAFYDISFEKAYSYIVWFILMFLMFVIFPSERSFL